MTSASDRDDPGLYARSFADVYDRWYRGLHDVDRIVDSIVAATHRDAVVLELGSGSGRIAGPLSAQRRVIALDASTAMLEQDDSPSLRVAADMVDLPLAPDSVDCVTIAYNTILNVGRRSLQRQCFAEARRVVRSTGILVLEAFVAPDLGQDPFGMTIANHHTDADARIAIVTWRDPSQPDHITGSHVELAPWGVRSRPWHLTYRSPADLDELAAEAGFELVERSADWNGAPFGPDASRHVSWYRRRAHDDEIRPVGTLPQ